MIIAIDGTAASGKGTLGRALATRLDLDYLDTGQLYRALAHNVQQKELDIDELNDSDFEQFVSDLPLSNRFGSELRTAEISELASKVAAIPSVRTALLDRQRDFAKSPPGGKGAVVEGRDIGTVVLPDADAKFYVDAAADIRANRRHCELKACGSKISLCDVLADIVKRDCRDKNRTVAPLIAADDAFFIDSSEKNAEEVLQMVLDHLKQN